MVKGQPQWVPGASLVAVTITSITNAVLEFSLGLEWQLGPPLHGLQAVTRLWKRTSQLFFLVTVGTGPEGAAPTVASSSPLGGHPWM
jgi:hypothetical protein